VRWGINTLPTAALSIDGRIDATGDVLAKTMVVERANTMDLGESADMSSDEFAKLVSGKKVDLGMLAVEMHRQVHTHKQKIANLDQMMKKLWDKMEEMESRR